MREMTKRCLFTRNSEPLLFFFINSDSGLPRTLFSGFVQEGRQRKANWVEGAWKDIIQMGILVEEWNDARKKR
jgi:hypothetical protein